MGNGVSEAARTRSNLVVPFAKSMWVKMLVSGSPVRAGMRMASRSFRSVRASRASHSIVSCG